MLVVQNGTYLQYVCRSSGDKGTYVAEARTIVSTRWTAVGHGGTHLLHGGMVECAQSNASRKDKNLCASVVWLGGKYTSLNLPIEREKTSDVHVDCPELPHTRDGE